MPLFFTRDRAGAGGGDRRRRRRREEGAPRGFPAMDMDTCARRRACVCGSVWGEAGRPRRWTEQRGREGDARRRRRRVTRRGRRGVCTSRSARPRGRDAPGGAISKDDGFSVEESRSGAPSRGAGSRCTIDLFVPVAVVRVGGGLCVWARVRGVVGRRCDGVCVCVSGRQRLVAGGACSCLWERARVWERAGGCASVCGGGSSFSCGFPIHLW